MCRKFHRFTKFFMSFKLNQIGQQLTGIEEINQCLRILLLTQQRSLPNDPEFGTSIADYLTNPEQNRALIVAEVFESIAKYEPRAKVISVDVSESGLITVQLEGLGEIIF
jgi:uncharacterized protein